MRRSETIAKLAEALSKAHAKFKPVIKGAENPFFKNRYADLATLIEATKGALSENGLVVMQAPGKFLDERKMVVTTTVLAHSSGEWIEEELEMPLMKVDAQGVGSAISYARRYAYQSILNVAGEDEDDGNLATGKSEKARENDEQYDQRTENQRLVMPAQAQAMHEAMKRTGKTEALVTDYLGKKGYKQFEQVLRVDFQEILKWLNSAQKANKADLTPDLQKSVRDAVNKKLWAVAAGRSVPEGDIKTYAYERFGVDSMAKLSADQLRDVLEWVNLLS